jgi:hypothetical protein
MEKLSLQELQPLIIGWANEKGLIKIEIAPKQRLKLLEEVGETANAILNNNIEEIKDGVGDIFVVLVILYAQENIDYDFTMPIYDKILDMDEQGRLMNLLYYHDAVGFEELQYFCLESELDLVECANLAWNEIKDRKGKTVNGTFIKEKQKK